MADQILCTDPCTADEPCFGHKLAYWRENGMQVSYPYGGRKEWNGPTVRERAAQAVADARSAGIEPEYQGRACLR